MSSAIHSANSPLSSSMACSPRLMAAESRPPLPTFAFSMFGGVKTSIGCLFVIIAPGQRQSGRVTCIFFDVHQFRRAAFGTFVERIDAAPPAGAKIGLCTDERPGTFDHRDQPAEDRLRRDGLGEKFGHAGVARGSNTFLAAIP